MWCLNGWERGSPPRRPRTNIWTFRVPHTTRELRSGPIRWCVRRPNICTGPSSSGRVVWALEFSTDYLRFTDPTIVFPDQSVDTRVLRTALVSHVKPLVFVFVWTQETVPGTGAYLMAYPISWAVREYQDLARWHGEQKFGDHAVESFWPKSKKIKK